MLATASLLIVLAIHRPYTDGGVVPILAESALDPALDAARLTQRLKALGPEALPELCTVLARGVVSERPLTPIEEAALLDALQACPRNALHEHVRTRLSLGADTDERRVYLRALARVATAHQLTLMRSAASAGAESAALADALEEAVAGVLRRDERAAAGLRQWLLQASPDVEPPLVRGVAASTSPRALDMLVELLGYRPSLDHSLVPAIGGLLRAAPKPVAGKVITTLADLLGSDDPQIAREAALALGESEGFAATAQLVELLGHEHAGVRAGAATALEHLSGLAFGESRERWNAWYDAEAGWLRIYGPDLQEQLRTGSIGTVARALGEISQHRLHRSELATEVAQVLHHEDERARRLACFALARLGSSVAVPALLDVLADPAPSVRAAANVALRALGAEAQLTADETDEELEG